MINKESIVFYYNILKTSLDEGITLKLNNEEDFFISFDIALSTTSSIVIILKELRKTEEIVWNLHYTCARSLIYVKVNLLLFHCNI